MFSRIGCCIAYEAVSYTHLDVYKRQDLKGGGKMQSNTAAQISTIAAKPILKWAGGKTQMLGQGKIKIIDKTVILKDKLIIEI